MKALQELSDFTVESYNGIDVLKTFRALPWSEGKFERLNAGEYRLVRLAPPPNEGVVDWLLDCPEKGYFVPIESDSTDTL